MIRCVKNCLDSVYTFITKPNESEKNPPPQKKNKQKTKKNKNKQTNKQNKTKKTKGYFEVNGSAFRISESTYSGTVQNLSWCKL